MKISEFIQAQGGIEACHAKLLTHPNPKWKYFTGKCPKVEQMQPFIDRMKWQEVEQVTAWLDAVSAPIEVVPFPLFNGSTIMYNSNVPPYNELPDRPLDIGGIIYSHFTVMPSAKVSHKDRLYSKLSYSDLVWLAEHQPSIAGSNDEGRDCDNSVDAFMGWLSLQGISDAAIGRIDTQHYNYGNHLFAHACVVAIDDTNTPWIIDPANSREVVPHDYKYLTGYNVAGIKIPTTFEISRIDY